MNKTEYPISYAVINKEEEIRKKSSSGGVFYLAAKEILNNGGVVFGARLNPKGEVEHSYCEKLEDLEPFLGSKYVQSKMSRTYNNVLKFLKEKRNVLFSGTPCQIAGLKSFLGKEYENLYTIDLACHGVPSRMVWRKYLEENFQQEKIQKIRFRDKSEGWKDYSLKIESETGVIYQKKFRKDSYLKGFVRNLYLRPSCYQCNFKGLVRKADMTLADFWGIEKILPELDDNKGTSLVLIHTSKGMKLWNSMMEQCIYKEVSLDDGIKENSAMVRSVSYTEKRKDFYEKISTGSDVKETVEELLKRSFWQKVKGRLRTLIKKMLR